MKRRRRRRRRLVWLCGLLRCLVCPRCTFPHISWILSPPQAVTHHEFNMSLKNFFKLKLLSPCLILAVCLSWFFLFFPFSGAARCRPTVHKTMDFNCYISHTHWRSTFESTVAFWRRTRRFWVRDLTVRGGGRQPILLTRLFCGDLHCTGNFVSTSFLCQAYHSARRKDHNGRR